MKLDKVANSGNDEFYTPRYAITPLLKHIRERGYNNIWCPFDTEDSLFVKIFREEGMSVVATHLETGHDFFNTDIVCDCIISNPPYSLKGEVFERLFSLDKPFAMLVGVVGIFESEKRFTMFETNDFEVMYFNRRVSYFQDYTEQKPSRNPPFSSVYIAKDMFPRQITFERIDKKDTK